MQVCRIMKEDKLKVDLLIVTSTSRGVVISSSYVGTKQPQMLKTPSKSKIVVVVYYLVMNKQPQMR